MFHRKVVSLFSSGMTFWRCSIFCIHTLMFGNPCSNWSRTSVWPLHCLVCSVLPAFAGNVPSAITKEYPSAKVTRLGEWWGSPSSVILLMDYFPQVIGFQLDPKGSFSNCSPQIYFLWFTPCYDYSIHLWLPFYCYLKYWEYPNSFYLIPTSGCNLLICVHLVKKPVGREHFLLWRCIWARDLPV